MRGKLRSAEALSIPALTPAAVQCYFSVVPDPPRLGAAIIKDDHYAISVAKTAYRDAYNNADLDLLLGVFASGFTDCSHGEPSFYGEEAVQALRIRTRELFEHFEVRMRVLIIEIVVKGEFAYDWGWHKVRLTEKSTGQVNETKYRYFETWKKENGAWKIDYIITNRELPPRMLPEPAGESR